MTNDFGRFLKDRRQEKGLTQKELANALFVSSSAVSKWEKNSARPDIALLPKLSELLGVTEHELITASIDHSTRAEKSQAKKWRTFSSLWNMFFYIAYAIALLVCFICNLAVNRTLSWFWLVLASLTLSFTLTNLPSIVKRNRLIVLPVSFLCALYALLATCALYTKGDWFFITAIAVLLPFTMVFAPVYVAKYKIFERIKKWNAFLSVGLDFILLNVLLVVANAYALSHGYTAKWWYFPVALPSAFYAYGCINALLCVRFLKINRAYKAGVVLTLVALFLYIPPVLFSVRNPILQKELNVFKADFSCWKADVTLENNVHCIVFLTLLTLGVIFCFVGALLRKKK